MKQNNTGASATVGNKVSRRLLLQGLATTPTIGFLLRDNRVLALPLTPGQAAAKAPAKKSNLIVSCGDFFKDHKFINCAKAGSRIIRDGAGSPDWYLSINADHYPTNSAFGIAFSTYLHGVGTYIIKWQGNGSVTGVSIGAKRNAAKGIWTGGGADGRVVTNGRFTCTGGNGYSVFIVKGPTISNLVICRVDEEDALDAGQIFRTDYLNLIKSFNGVLRFSISSDATNRSVLANWADRPQINLMTYNSGRYYANRKVGQVQGMNDYTAPAYVGMPATYAQAEIIHFTVDKENTATTCTLNVGGRGAKPLLNEYLAQPVTAGTNAATRLLATVNYTAVYDALLECWIFNSQYPVIGQPLETMIAECNAAGCPGWFSVPFYASDDYVKKYAQLFCDSYKPSVVYFEYVNEIWNYAFGFPMTTRAAKYGAKTLGLSGGNNADFSGWYGYRFSQVADIIRSVFMANGQAAKVKMVYAGQGAQGDSATSLQVVIENTRFQNKAVAALSGASTPISRTDVVSYAIYYGGMSTAASDNGWTAIAGTVRGPLKAAVDQYLSGDPKLVAAAFAWMKNDFLQREAQNLAGRFKNWNALAAKYHKEVRLYEANHEVTPPSEAWCAANLGDPSYGDTSGTRGKIHQFLLAFYNSDAYQEVVTTYLRDFYALSQSAGFSLSGFCSPEPWSTFPKDVPSDVTGNSALPPLANWRAHVVWNNS
jgi:hypothetical protein